MCWNWQVSIITWLVGLGSAIYMFHRRNKYDITFASLILAYSSMQLWEALMWWSQDCGKLNTIASIGAYFALWSHTLAIGIGLYIEEKLILPLVIGIAFMLVAAVQAFTVHWKCSKPAETGCHGKACRHIVWGFPHEYYVYVFAVCIAISLVCIKPLWKAILTSFIFIASFGLSALYAKNATGSFWCWVAAAFSFVFVIINKY